MKTKPMQSTYSVIFRTCNKCLAEKPLTEFYFRADRRRRSWSCKACANAATKARAALDPMKRRETAARWRRDNPERSLAHSYRAYKKAMLDPSKRATDRLRKRLRHQVIGMTHLSNFVTVAGVSVEYLRRHFEKLFRDGMSWENYGSTWEIDHVKACSKFDLTDPEQCRACFHYSNLQPLSRAENRRKHNH
jgi:hypothetical protein